jgi:hypothetical protein
MGLGEAVSYCYAWEYLFDSALRLRREQVANRIWCC